MQTNFLNSNSILLDHYLALAKRSLSVLGISLIVASLFGPLTAVAAGAQITSRLATLGSSLPSASTTYAFSFKLPSNGTTIKAVMIQLCTTPLETTGCTGAAGADFTAGPTTLSAQGGQFSGWTLGAGTPPAPTANTLFLFSASGFSEVSATTQTLTLSSVKNPTTAHGVQYYARITTYQNYNISGGLTEQDYGAVALATADQVQVTANVQESLTFCVYDVAGACGTGVTQAVKLGTGTDNILSASTPSGGQSKMDASTNAQTGYVITYNAANLASTNDTITAAGAGPSSFVAGTSMFGVNVASTNTFTGTASGSGVGIGRCYNNVSNCAVNNQVTFVPAAATGFLDSAGGPLLTNTYIVSYIAQAGNTTKPGAFSTTFTWVCTGTF